MDKIHALLQINTALSCSMVRFVPCHLERIPGSWTPIRPSSYIFLRKVISHIDSITKSRSDERFGIRTFSLCNDAIEKTYADEVIIVIGSEWRKIHLPYKPGLYLGCTYSRHICLKCSVGETAWSSGQSSLCFVIRAQVVKMISSFLREYPLSINIG